MPLHAVCSTVRPASYLYGAGAHYGGPNSMTFPQYAHQLFDIIIHMAHNI